MRTLPNSPEERGQYRGISINQDWVDLIGATAVALIFWRFAEWWWLAVPLVVVLIYREIGAARALKTRKIEYLLFGIFLLSGLWSVLVAYQSEGAFLKWLCLVGGVLLYMTVSRLRSIDPAIILLFVGLVGIILSAYFVLTYDYIENPTDMELLNSFGRKWMAVRPDSRIPGMVNDIAGGIIGMIIPLLAGLGLQAKKYMRKRLLTWAVIGIVLLLVGFILTGARSAWVSLIITGGLLLGIQALRWVAPIMKPNWKQGLAIVAVITLVMIIWMWQGRGGFVENLQRDIEQIPGYGSIRGRLLTLTDSVYLAIDQPITGAGLGSFPGLYSRYILGIDEYYYAYSHSLFVDIFLEQGVFGFLSVLAVFVLAFAGVMQSWTGGKGEYIGCGIFASLIFIMTNGFIEDPLYSYGGTPFLFLSPALAIMALNGNDFQHKKFKFKKVMSLSTIIILIATSAIILLGGWKYIASQIYSNVGAVLMNKAELNEFPETHKQDYMPIAGLDLPKDLFLKSLVHNPRNVTAHYRLGLIALHEKDFTLAREHLLDAYRLNPDHRGIRKALGYTSLWMGDIPTSIALLKWYPEVDGELTFWSEWWNNEDRVDLAGRVTAFRRTMTVVE